MIDQYTKYSLLLIVSAFLFSCGEIESELLNSSQEDQLSSMRPDKIDSDWLKRKFACKPFEKYYQTQKDIQLRQLANKISNASPAYFSTKDISNTLCIISEVGIPADIGDYYKYKVLLQDTSNSFPDQRSGFLSIGPDNESEQTILAVLAHELAHFVSDHANLWHASQAENTRKLRHEVLELYKKSVPLNSEFVHQYKIIDEIEQKNVGVIPPETEKKVLALGQKHRDFEFAHRDRIDHMESSLKAELVSHFIEPYDEKLEVHGYLAEAEADEVGMLLFRALGNSSEDFINAFGPQLFRSQQQYTTCVESLENMEEPFVGNKKSSHPDSCWRVWRLKKLSKPLNP